MRGQISWYHLGCFLAYISSVRSTPIHQYNEPLLLDTRSILDKEDYPRENDEALEVPGDRDIYQIIIPKKGQSIVYDDMGSNKQEEMNPEDVLSLLQPASVRQHYDYYLPEVYTESEMEDPYMGILSKEGTVKRLDELSRVKDKKDLESLLYQANPALTVQKLPLEPQIDFRKYNQNKHNKSYDEPSAEKNEEAADEEKKSFRKQLRGMEEVIQPRPSIRRDRTMRGIPLTFG